MWSVILAVFGLPLTALWWVILNVAQVGLLRLGVEIGQSLSFDAGAELNS